MAGSLVPRERSQAGKTGAPFRQPCLRPRLPQLRGLFPPRGSGLALGHPERLTPAMGRLRPAGVNSEPSTGSTHSFTDSQGESPVLPTDEALRAKAAR